MADDKKQSQRKKPQAVKPKPGKQPAVQPEEQLAHQQKPRPSEQPTQSDRSDNYLIVQKQPWMREEAAFNLDLIFDDIQRDMTDDFDAVFDELFIKTFNREHDNLDILILQKELENGDLAVKLRFSDKDFGKSLDELNTIAKDLQRPEASDASKQVGRKIHERLADKLEQSNNKTLSDFGTRIRSFLNGTSNIAVDALASPNLNSLTGRPYDFLASADNTNIDQTERQEEMENTGSKNLTPGG